MNTLHVKKGDTVIVLSGESKGKTGKVIRVFPGRSMVLVEGINMVKRHMKSTKDGTKGQIVDKHHPIHASKVSLSGGSGTSGSKNSKEKKIAQKTAK